MHAASIGHVAVNALFLEPRMGGLGTYVLRLLPELAELRPGWRISVFANPSGRELLAAQPWADAVELVPAFGVQGTRAMTELTVIGLLADARRADVVHSVAMTGPLRSRAARVVTIPDVIWLTHPDPGERHTARLWRVLVPRVARRADRVLVLSQANRTAVVERLRVNPAAVDVVPLACERPGTDAADEAELRARLALGDGPVVLAVSAAKKHKNVAKLVEAMSQVTARRPSTVLVVPGNPTSLHRELREQAVALGVAGNVRFPGWLADRDLECLYRGCSCFAFPSLEEGFGLPVLEAMSRGAPVACSRIASLTEVAGDAAVYFDPHDARDIAEALLRIVEAPDEAARLGRAGQRRSELFSWRRTAELTIESYERAVQRRGARAAAG